jgi:hypothetical protein
MATTTTTTNKPLNPRAQDLSPKGYNRAALYSGKALDFDGVNDDISGSNSFSETTHSISAYIQTSSASAYKSIFEFRDSGADGGVIWVLPGNNLVYQINGVSTTNFNVNADEWYHVVGTYDGTNQSIYINGNLWETKTNSGSVLVSANWKIGSRSFSTGSNWFDGMIGGVKLFNTALTTAQVADLYLNPEKIVPDGVADSALKLWLPMMEGAGTTAYDGSGNGNHGTINGATWTAGIGAPVAQTALVSWNKGVNLQINSEDFTQSNWLKEDLSVTANATTAPDGSNTAYKIVANTTNIDHAIFDPIANASYVHSVFAKAGEYDYIFLGKNNNLASDGVFFDLVNGTINQNTSTLTATIEAVSGADGWYRCSVIGNITYPIIALSENGTSFLFAGDDSSGVYIWGASMISGTTAGPYVRTGATAQTSPVLIPQGLTANKDITGVNAFESARNPYALNLDGASWAEVHDNASLDITSAITLEGWVYVDVSKDIRGALVAKYKFSQNARAYSLELDDLTLKFILSSNGTSTTSVAGSTTISTTGWYHFVGTYDGANVKVYLNGSEDNTTAYSSGVYAQDYPVTIGVLDTASKATSIMEDQIALPRIYNRALTATEVARNYNADKSKFGL